MIPFKNKRPLEPGHKEYGVLSLSDVGLVDQQLWCIYQIYSQIYVHSNYSICLNVFVIAFLILWSRLSGLEYTYNHTYMIIPYNMFILYSISLAFCSYCLTLYITSRQPMFGDICKPQDRWPCGKWHFTENGHVTDWQTTYRCVVILNSIKEIYMKWINRWTVFHIALNKGREQTVNRISKMTIQREKYGFIRHNNLISI